MVEEACMKPVEDSARARRRKRVCVVGAGITGLAAAKVFQDDGFDVVVFEKEARIGGVWASSRTYPGLRTNGPRESYAFSDLPYPQTADDFPTAEQVRQYLAMYVEHFGLGSLIRTSHEVASISCATVSTPLEPRFRVTIQRTDSSEPV
jgi:dimethylaniline monooxygenase (N-oxide forming)